MHRLIPVLAAGALFAAPLCAVAQDSTAQDSPTPEGASAPAPGAAAAPGTPPAPLLLLELNNAADIAPDEGGTALCRMTYVVTNRSDVPLRAVSWQVGIFDGAGIVRALLLLGVGDLSEGKTKIAVYDMPGWRCADISRVVVSDAAECTPAHVEPVAQADGRMVWPQADFCLAGLGTATRTDIEFGL